MTKEELIARNKKFIIEVMTLAESLPQNRIYDSLVRQIVRSSSSVGANYRAACRAKSTADFINKLKIVEEEVDETSFFLDLMHDLDKGSNKEKIKTILKESNELVSIYSASVITSKRKLAEAKNRNSKTENLK
ncbi:MAG: four helix bundle protein [Cyclobacteriaceae bacterium]|nr:four helix bundle protein [Cyclobacteriaceae bacterium]